MLDGVRGRIGLVESGRLDLKSSHRAPGSFPPVEHQIICIVRNCKLSPFIRALVSCGLQRANTVYYRLNLAPRSHFCVKLCAKIQIKDLRHWRHLISFTPVSNPVNHFCLFRVNLLRYRLCRIADLHRGYHLPISGRRRFGLWGDSGQICGV